MELFNQIIILLLGAAGVYFLNTQNQRKYGSILMLVSQPFWLYTTFTTNQWGMFALSLFYTICWIKGTYIDWKHLWEEPSSKQNLNQNS